jgi:hypothetical protein
MKHKDEIVAYLDRYSSKTQPKSISEIAETLSIDEESVGFVIHDLLATHVLGIEKSPDKYNFLYYKIV